MFSIGKMKPDRQIIGTRKKNIDVIIASRVALCFQFRQRLATDHG